MAPPRSFGKQAGNQLPRAKGLSVGKKLIVSSLLTTLPLGRFSTAAPFLYLTP